jgi:predicted ArsR family transcriptional regulator
MHAAKVEKSERLKRVLQLLRSRGSKGATTREIIEAAQVCAVNSIIAELRANGFHIECRFEQRTDRGAAIYRYTLVEKAQGELFGRTA